MRCSPSLVLTLIVLGTSGAAHAQGPEHKPEYKNVGRTPSENEVHAWDIAIGPEGKELPPGSGTAKQGATIFAQKCAPCHGPNGEGGVNGQGGPPLFKSRIGTLWPYATTLWDYINRDMPWKQGQSLNPDEVYALTALLLYQNSVIQETDVMDAKSLPKVRMPNRDGFVPERPVYKPNAPNQAP
jgi:S-disulfanyl-L-cysteine oxidoreductase SoxD